MLLETSENNLNLYSNQAQIEILKSSIDNKEPN